MNTCEEIRQTIDVDVPVKTANAEWTQFAFASLYYRSVEGPDEGDAEEDAGFVRLEALDEHRTRVTVDLNYCPQYAGIDDPAEIAKLQKHLQATLRSYKRFVESQQA